MNAGRPSHLIAPDEVDAWLADSAVRVVTYHRTTLLASRAILERGVDIARSRIGAYGQGFYTASRPDPFFGEASLTVAVRLRQPLVGSQELIAAQIDSLIYDRYGSFRPITPPVAGAIRRDLIRLGYDGLVIRDADGEGTDFIIALFGASVKVLQV